MREAFHPTDVPDGELREAKGFDQAGRPFFEFFGKPSSWMSQFAGDRRRLAGIRTATATGFNPTNLS